MKVERPRARSSAAPTRLNSRSTMPICAARGRNEGADLRQHDDQRVLAEEGRLAGHVRAGHHAGCACRRPFLGAEPAIIADEACRRRRASESARPWDGGHPRRRRRGSRRSSGAHNSARSPTRRARHGGRARQGRRSPPRARSCSASTASVSCAKISSSSASARSAAVVMRASSSASSGVEKRMTLASVWRWMNISSCGGLLKRAGIGCASTSTK